jgi:hypothetical protein
LYEFLNLFGWKNWLINSTHGFPFGFHIRRYICFSGIFLHQYVEQSLTTSMFMTTIVDLWMSKGTWHFIWSLISRCFKWDWWHIIKLVTWGHKNIWCNYVTKAIRALFQSFSHIYILLCKGWGIQLANHCECIELYSV